MTLTASVAHLISTIRWKKMSHALSGCPLTGNGSGGELAVRTSFIHLVVTIMEAANVSFG